MNFRNDDHPSLTDDDLAQVFGAADTTAADERKQITQELSARRDQLLDRQVELKSQRWSPWDYNPIKTFMDYAQVRGDLQSVAKQLNAEGARDRLEKATQQAHDADLKELEEQHKKDQEAEENDWLKQAAAELAAEAAAHQGGGAAGPPANADAGPGESLPSFPTHIINPPPSHEPTIILEPIEHEHRLY